MGLCFHGVKRGPSPGGLTLCVSYPPRQVVLQGARRYWLGSALGTSGSEAHRGGLDMLLC